MEDVSDVEMEVDKDEETNDDKSSDENRNVEFEEEVTNIFSVYLKIKHLLCSGKNIIGEEKS